MAAAAARYRRSPCATSAAHDGTLSPSSSRALISTIPNPQSSIIDCESQNTLEKREFINTVETKRRHIARMLQIMRVQTEEHWDSNIDWILRGSGRKATNSAEELERWNDTRMNDRARGMEEGILSSLLRWVGPTEQIGTEDVRTILLRIYLCIL